MARYTLGFILGLFVICTTLLNLAFTLMPETMTGLVRDLVST